MGLEKFPVAHWSVYVIDLGFTAVSFLGNKVSLSLV